MPLTDHPPDAFPLLRAVARLADQSTKAPSGPIHNNSTSTVYDVKFYPYTTAEEEPVFAVVVAREIYVCRPNVDWKQPIEILRIFRDPKKDASLNSLVWSQDPVTADPLICFGGAGSSKIKIVNVTTGEYVRTLSGHGAAINDLAISPLAPTILASASADHTARLWNLDPAYKKYPCAALFAGAGHKQHVLALSFHRNGRYLLSGGADAMVNLWAVPEVPDANAGTDKTTIVYYPLFSSTEVHSDYVDCIRFYGDLILSHAATSSSTEKKNSILLWKIDGFSSSDPVPQDPPIPVPGSHTRSAFASRFSRLLTFDMPNTTPFYMRFSLFDGANAHPILVMGNEKSRFSFWDLQKLEQGPSATDLSTSSRSARTRKKRGGGGTRSGKGARTTTKQQAPPQEGYITEADDEDGYLTAAAETEAEDPLETTTDPRYDVSDPFAPIPAHYTLVVPKYNFTTRQIAWSSCGKWCVAVGEIGLICIFKRWD